MKDMVKKNKEEWRERDKDTKGIMERKLLSLISFVHHALT
jgi:hypothetical protein